MTSSIGYNAFSGNDGSRMVSDDLDAEIAEIMKMKDVGLNSYAKAKNIRIYDEKGNTLKKNNKLKLIVNAVTNKYLSSTNQNDPEFGFIDHHAESESSIPEPYGRTFGGNNEKTTSPALDAEIAEIMRMNNAELISYAKTNNIYIYDNDKKILKKNDKLKLIINIVTDKYLLSTNQDREILTHNNPKLEVVCDASNREITLDNIHEDLERNNIFTSNEMARIKSLLQYGENNDTKIDITRELLYRIGRTYEGALKHFKERDLFNSPFLIFNQNFFEDTEHVRTRGQQGKYYYLNKDGYHLFLLNYSEDTIKVILQKYFMKVNDITTQFLKNEKTKKSSNQSTNDNSFLLSLGSHQYPKSIDSISETPSSSTLSNNNDTIGAEITEVEINEKNEVPALNVNNELTVDIASEIKENEGHAYEAIHNEVKNLEIPGKSSIDVVNWILQIRGPLTRFTFADFIGYDITSRGFYKFLEIKCMPKNTRFFVTKELVECMGYEGDRVLHDFEKNQLKPNINCILLDKTDDFLIGVDLPRYNFPKNKRNFYTCTQSQLIDFFTNARTSTGQCINKYLSESEDLYVDISQIISSIRGKKMIEKLGTLNIESEHKKREINIIKYDNKEFKTETQIISINEIDSEDRVFSDNITIDRDDSDISDTDDEYYVIYRDGDFSIRILFKDKTLWFSEYEFQIIFQKSKSTINEHINNIFYEGELQEKTIVRKFRTEKNHLSSQYNLKMFIALAFRVQSPRAKRFRVIANNYIEALIVNQTQKENQKLIQQMETLRVESERRQRELEQEKIDMEERYKKELSLHQYKYEKAQNMISKWTAPRQSGCIYIVSTINMAKNRRLKGGRTSRPINVRLGEYNGTGTSQSEEYYLFYCRETDDMIRSEQLIFMYFKLFREKADPKRKSTLPKNPDRSILTEVLSGVSLPLAIKGFDKIMDICNDINSEYDMNLQCLLEEVQTDSNRSVEESKIYDWIKEINEMSAIDRIDLFNDVPAIALCARPSGEKGVSIGLCPRELKIPTSCDAAIDKDHYHSIRDYISHFKYSLIHHLKLNILEKYSVDDFKSHDIRPVANRFMIPYLFI